MRLVAVEATFNFEAPLHTIKLTFRAPDGTEKTEVLGPMGNDDFERRSRLWQEVFDQQES